MQLQQHWLWLYISNQYWNVYLWVYGSSSFWINFSLSMLPFQIRTSISECKLKRSWMKYCTFVHAQCSVLSDCIHSFNLFDVMVSLSLPLAKAALKKCLLFIAKNRNPLFKTVENINCWSDRRSEPEYIHACMLHACVIIFEFIVRLNRLPFHFWTNIVI